MTTAIPEYDITLDEMSVALSYVTMALGDAAVPAAPAKKLSTKKAAAPEPKKEAKKEDVSWITVSDVSTVTIEKD